MVISPAPLGAPCLPSKDGRLVPISCPDGGGSLGANLQLCVNYFLLRFDAKMIIYHYDVDVRPENLPVGSPAPGISKSYLSAVKKELFRAHFTLQVAAHDGQRTLYNSELLSEGNYQVLVQGRQFSAALKLVNSLPLREFIQTPLPPGIPQGLDVVMRENSCRGVISTGNSFYPEHNLIDLGRGAIALHGFRQSIKSTVRGLVLSVKDSALAFYEPMNVVAYLENYMGFKFSEHMHLDDRQRKNVEQQLKGLKTTVTHGERIRKYTIFSLTSLKAIDLSFTDDNSGEKLEASRLLHGHVSEDYMVQATFMFRVEQEQA